MDSIKKVKNIILNRVLKVLLLSSSLIISLTIILFRKVEEDLNTKANILVTVRTPKPPSCSRITMMDCPNKVKSLPVSKMANPVTVTALVEVNSACTKVTFLYEAAGSMSMKVPKSIKKIKLNTNSSAGCKLVFPRLAILKEMAINPTKTAKNKRYPSTSNVELSILVSHKNDINRYAAVITKNINLATLMTMLFVVRNKNKLIKKAYALNIKFSGLYRYKNSSCLKYENPVCRI